MKTPPFAELMQAFIKLSIEYKTHITIFCGKSAWKSAKDYISHGSLALCLPPADNPEDYSWPVNGFNIILFDTGSMSLLGLKRAAYSLLKGGAKLVHIYSDLCPNGLTYKP